MSESLPRRADLSTVGAGSIYDVHLFAAESTGNTKKPAALCAAVTAERWSIWPKKDILEDQQKPCNKQSEPLYSFSGPYALENRRLTYES